MQVEDRSWHNATVLGSDAARDLAVLSICCSQDFMAASLSGARAPQGASVFAMGYPLDAFDSGVASLTDGVVSRVFLDTDGKRWLVQTNAEINPGNSGGPLFAMSGEVVGVNAFIQRETAGGLNIEGYGFAVASETVIDLLPVLKAGRTIGGATPAPTPRAQPTPTPWRGSRNSFGPADGAMSHDNDDYIEEYEANVHVSDFSAAATFVNPSSAGWDYGFLFRSAGENRFHVVALTDDGRWFHYLRDGSAESRDMDRGWTGALRTQAGASNEVRLVAAVSTGWLFVNGEFVTGLDLGGGASTGDVAVMTGYHQGAESPGSATQFRGFSVREPRLVADASGELVHVDDDLIETNYVVGGISDFIVAVTFTNPYPTHVWSWDYGVGFRDERSKSNTFDAVAVSSDGVWEHFRRAGGISPTHRDSGRVRLNLGADGENALWLMALGNVGVLYVNDEQVGSLNLSGSVPNGDLWVGTEFYTADEAPGYGTGYDLQVWSLD